MNKNRFEEFSKDPKKALIKLAIPVVIGMLVQVLYQIVDTAFVGRLGTDALAALSISFPIFFILIALSSGIASGVNARIARYLGEKKKAMAERTAVHGVLLSVAAALLVFVAGEFGLSPLLSLLGAKGEVLRLAHIFMETILYAAFFMLPSAAFAGIFASQGDTKTSMKVQVSSLLINIVLDPLLIYTAGLGVRGAAIATGIAAFFSLILFIYFTERSYIKMTWNDYRHFKFSATITKEILSIGVPASMMMLIIATYTMFNNYLMAHFGDAYIAAAGMVLRIESLVTLPMVALSMALLTLTGMFHGARRHDLLEKTVWHAIKVGVGFSFVVMLLVFLFPNIFLRIFTDDPALIKIASDYLRIYALGFPLIAIAMNTSRVMQGMGRAFSSFFIHLFRLYIVAVPLAFYLIYVLEASYLAVAGSMVFGNFVSNVLSIIWVKKNVNKGAYRAESI